MDRPLDAVPVPAMRTALQALAEEEGLADVTVSFSEGAGAGNNYLGVLHACTLSGAGLTLRLMCKTPSASAQLREVMPITHFFVREAHFYDSVAPVYEALYEERGVPPQERFPFVKCYRADSSYLREILVMEDLAARGFRMLDRHRTLDYEHTTLVLRNVARLHALSFAMREHRPRLYREAAEHVERFSMAYFERVKQFYCCMVDRTMDLLEEPGYREVLSRFAGRAYDCAMACVDPAASHPHTVLCHGDMWAPNIMFQYTGASPTALHLVDWQMTKLCSPLVDVTHLLFSSTAPEVRARYWELLELYHDELAAALQRLGCRVEVCFPRDILLQQQRSVASYGLIMAIISLNLSTRENDDVPDLLNLIDTDVKEIVFTNYKNDKSLRSLRSRVKSIIDDFVRLDLL